MTTKPKTNGANDAPEPLTPRNRKLEDYILTHFFKEKDIPCSEKDLIQASTDVINYLRHLQDTAFLMKQGVIKPKQREVIRQTKKPEYSTVYSDVAQITVSEFIHMMTKEQILDICSQVYEFRKHRDTTNTLYEETHKSMTADHKEFLLFRQAKNQKLKEPIRLASLSNSRVFKESMTLEDQVLFELTDRAYYDEYGLPYYL